jgi:hypothetical protein
LGYQKAVREAQLREGVNLVNVRIHQFQSGGAVVDAAALKTVRGAMATYRALRIIWAE